MASQVKTGVFQTMETVSETNVLIRDQVYGEHSITETVLIHLLRSPELLRLKGICQHGVTTFLGFGPKVTRFEHSVGAFLLVRTVGGSVEEQIAALLHDISHTSLSHVVDDALSKPGEESYHEVHKSRFLKTTQLPDILTEYGFGNLKALEEDLFRLVEMPAPHLCADRLDYALRDALAFEKLSLNQVREIYQSTKAFPSASSHNRLLVLEDQNHALILARAYQATDRDVWSNRAQANLYKRTGSIIRDLVHSGRVKEEALWKLSDEDFWTLLRQQATPEILSEMNAMESQGLPDEEELRLPRDAKIRTIDPDIYQGPQNDPLPLSVVLPEWDIERREYILSRESERE
ncbi:hypothetical protein N7466_007650 [Penicillium verhagenii]|uniref:uncharacterized protein n=1 Tax=Penicillium verhagenii TaxID=1562060 RepID=UPI0025454865|nr:uncharacterized protein N7466_007650 [Penicillium verhagenii]KAJ5928694.1 hypothetical protein N7466_007650 [Penicillium verhagenii]